MNETQRRINDLRAAWDQIFGNFAEEESAQLRLELFPDAVLLAPGNRLTAAFEEFRERGYFAEQNFACCSTCGMAAIPKEKTNRAVFYHAQSFDHMLEEGEVYLNWSGDGDEIVAVLKHHGLTVEWDGDPGAAILVKDLFEPKSGRPGARLRDRKAHSTRRSVPQGKN